MKKAFFVFLFDDVLSIVYNSKIINKKMNGIVFKGRIIDRLKFMEDFNKILKQEKLKTSLFGDNIYFVKNSYFNAADTFFLDSTLVEMGFNKVIYIDIKDLLVDKKATFVEVNNSYMVINLKDTGLFLDLDYFKDIPKIFDYLNDYLDDDIIVFGVNKIIPNLKLNNKSLYYLDNYASYVCDSLLKVKKYGA